MAKRTNQKKRNRKTKPPKPYRSWFEHDFHKRYNQLEYETLGLEYHVVRKYTPDFYSKGGRYLIELKGFFRHGDPQKYKAIRDCLPPQYELVFVWMDPHKPVTGARKKKDGTKTTYAQWCDKNNFKWATADTLPKEWTQT